MSRVLVDPSSPPPMLVRHSMKLLIEKIRLLEQRIAELEKELAEHAKQSCAGPDFSGHEFGVKACLGKGAGNAEREECRWGCAGVAGRSA
jgi:hypothetical protein